MNFRAILFVLGNITMLFGLCLAAPLVVALLIDSGTENEWLECAAFAGTMAFSVSVGAVLRRVYRDQAKEIRLREGFVVVSFSWLTMGAIGILPYVLSGAIPSVTDAFFETMSGLTTTGATILSDIEALPHGVQFWRCMTQWIGGMGIVVLSVALLPFLGVGGYHLLKAETPGGVAYERDRPRITENAQLMWRLYIGLTLTLVGLLWLGGMDLYHAACHAFTTMSTGGFSPHAKSLGHYTSPFIQWTVIVFMFLAGTNFSLHAYAFRRNFGAVWRNSEFKTYAALMVAVSLLFSALVPLNTGIEAHVRAVTFQVVSIVTTTGFGTADYDAWPQVVRLGFVLLMFIGGSMGSTSGGMKVARWVVYSKALVRELHRMVYPHAVEKVRINGSPVDQKLILNLFSFGLVWTGLFVLGSIVMAASGYDLPTATSASISALGNIGPGLAQVGPTADWSHLPNPGRE
ncbi:MAG: TrkH family potassium uptake protein [Myxococcota bacterium]